MTRNYQAPRAYLNELVEGSGQWEEAMCLDGVRIVVQILQGAAGVVFPIRGASDGIAFYRFDKVGMVFAIDPGKMFSLFLPLGSIVQMTCIGMGGIDNIFCEKIDVMRKFDEKLAGIDPNFLWLNALTDYILQIEVKNS